jgi:hypothetical protein
MGRGTVQVRSCGLVRKRDGARGAAEVKRVGRVINACFIDTLLIRDS